MHLLKCLHFDSLPVFIRPLQSFGCGGEGGGGEGGGGEGEGDGGSLQVFRHFWYFFLHSLLHCFFPTASTPAKKSTEMRSSISFIVSAHQGDSASDARADSNGKGQLYSSGQRATQTLSGSGTDCRVEAALSDGGGVKK